MNADAFLQAFHRIDDFLHVNRHVKKRRDAERAFRCLEQSVGLTRRTACVLAELITARVDDADAAAAMFHGVLVGLIASETAAEVHSTQLPTADATA